MDSESQSYDVSISLTKQVLGVLHRGRSVGDKSSIRYCTVNPGPGRTDAWLVSVNTAAGPQGAVGLAMALLIEADHA